jgi:hypothetical protein
MSSPATTDDTTFVRISKRELLSYIALATDLSAIKQENNDLRTKLQSLSIISPERATLPINADLPSSAGPVRSPPTPTGPASNPLTIKPNEPVALINSALAAFPPPPVTAEAYDENGRIVSRPIATSSVNYASIIETVIELIKLKHTQAQLQRDPINDAHIPQLYLPYMMTPEVTRIVMNAVELGVTRVRACALAGVQKPTYADWKQKASSQLEPYASFFALFELAEARTEAALVHAWRQHARDGWQASDAFLKKRFRNEWGDKQVVSLTRTDIANLPSTDLENALGPELISQLDADDYDNDATDTTDYTVDDDASPPTNSHAPANSEYPTIDEL